MWRDDACLLDMPLYARRPQAFCADAALEGVESRDRHVSLGNSLACVRPRFPKYGRDVTRPSRIHRSTRRRVEGARGRRRR